MFHEKKLKNHQLCRSPTIRRKSCRTGGSIGVRCHPIPPYRPIAVAAIAIVGVVVDKPVRHKYISDGHASAGEGARNVRAHPRRGKIHVFGSETLKADVDPHAEADAVRLQARPVDVLRVGGNKTSASIDARSASDEGECHERGRARAVNSYRA